MTPVPKQRRKAAFKLIESELRFYHQLKQKLEEEREHIIESTPFSDVPIHTGPGNPVLSKVLRLYSSAAIVETERRVRAIEHALTVTEQRDPRRIRFVELKYFENRLTDTGIMMELGISKSAFYRWRSDLVRLIAEQLGWEV